MRKSVGTSLPPHYDERIATWRDVEHHPMLWTSEHVEAHAEATLTMTP